MDQHLTRVMLSSRSDMLHWQDLLTSGPSREPPPYADLVSLTDGLEREMRWCIERLDEPDDRTLMFNMEGTSAARDKGVFMLMNLGEPVDLRRYKSALAELVEDAELFAALWAFLAVYELHVHPADIYAVRAD